MKYLALVLFVVALLGNASTHATENDMKRVTIGVAGMMKSQNGVTWMSWPNSVELALSELPGVKNVRVDLARDLFTVSYDESQTSTSNMFEAIQTLGYEPTLSVSEFSATPTISREQLPTEVLGLLDSNKPVSLYFGAKWCGACKIMERTTLANESVKKSLDRYRFLKVDIEEQEDISAGFSIRGVPTLLILNSSGDEVYRYIGPLTSSEISLVLDQFDES